MDNDIQLQKELQRVILVKNQSIDLLDALETTVIFLVTESDKTGIKLPNIKRLQSLLKHTHQLYDKIYSSTDTQQSQNNRRHHRTCLKN